MKFTIDYEPTPKGVPRVRFIQGRAITYYHPKTVEAIDNIRAILAEMCLKQLPRNTPLKLTVTYYRTKSKWLPKHEALPFRKPDLDNLNKTTGDCLSYKNGEAGLPPSVIPNDAQITTCNSQKRWSKNGHGYIDIELTKDRL